jgi:hypothetical protein
MSNGDYQSNLSAGEIVGRILTILREQRRGDWLLCRYLGDLTDGAYRGLGWSSDFFSFARPHFALSVKTLRERIRIRRALRDLPNIEQAFVARKLSYSRVREVTRVAKEETEEPWLNAALHPCYRAGLGLGDRAS